MWVSVTCGASWAINNSSGRRPRRSACFPAAVRSGGNEVEFDVSGPLAVVALLFTLV